MADQKVDLHLMADQALKHNRNLRVELVLKEDQDKIKDLDMRADHHLMLDLKVDQQWDKKDHCHQDNNSREDLNKELFLMESREWIHIVVMRVEQHILSLKVSMVNVKWIGQLLVLVIDNLMEDQMVIVLNQDQKWVNTEKVMVIADLKKRCKKWEEILKQEWDLKLVIKEILKEQNIIIKKWDKDRDIVIMMNLQW